MNPDPETAKVMTEGERVQNFVKGEDYRILVRPKLVKKIASLDSITDIPANMPASDRMIEYAARQLAIHALTSVIYDFEGDALRATDLQGQMAESREDDIIQRYN